MEASRVAPADGRAPWGAAFLLCGMGGLAAAVISSDGLYGLKVWLTGGMLVSLIGFEWTRAKHPVTPIGMIGLGGMLIFFLRPLMLPKLGVTSPGAAINSRMFTGHTVTAASEAALQVQVFLLALGLVYFYVLSRREIRMKNAAVDRDDSGIAATADEVHRAGVVLLLALAVAGTCALLLIHGSGGLAAHLAGVANRSEFLAGRFYLTLGYVPLAVCLVNYVNVRRRCPGIPAWSAFSLVAALVLLGVAFVTGGRGPLILGALVPLLLLKQIGPRPMRTPLLVASGALLVAGAMVMSILLRENVYTSGEAKAELEQAPVTALVNRLTSGAETKPFDSLTLLKEEDDSGTLPVLGGLTYLKATTWFVPSSLLPSKDGGANSWFTRTYLPTFYYPDHVETSISAIGEGYLNFRWPGILLVAALTGCAAGRLSRLRREASRLHEVLGVMLTPIFFSFVRGDAFQNLSLVVLLCLTAWAAVKLSNSASSTPRLAVLARPRSQLSAAR